MADKHLDKDYFLSWFFLANLYNLRIEVMKKFIAVLVLIGLIYGGYEILSGPFNEICSSIKPLFLGIRPAVLDSICLLRQDRLGDAELTKATKTAKCNAQTNSCSYFTPKADSGNLKVVITEGGAPAKGLEVVIYPFNASGPPTEMYVKYTDNNGVALFEGVPPGNYDVDYGKGSSGPSNPFQSYGVEDPVDIIKGQTIEKTIVHAETTGF